jgi:hypothetical protein
MSDESDSPSEEETSSSSFVEMESSSSVSSSSLANEEEKKDAHSQSSATPHWLLPTAMTGGGVKLGPFVNASDGLDISNHPPEAAQTAENENPRPILHAILVYRLSSTKDQDGVCLAKLDFTTPEPKDDTPPTPPQRKRYGRGVKVKPPQDGDENDTLDHHHIATIIQSNLPFQDCRSIEYRDNDKLVVEITSTSNRPICKC